MRTAIVSEYGRTRNPSGATQQSQSQQLSTIQLPHESSISDLSTTHKQKGSRRPKQSSDRQPAYLSCFVQSFEKSGRLKSNIPKQSPSAGEFSGTYSFFPTRG